jgi:hypothetical protein
MARSARRSAAAISAAVLRRVQAQLALQGKSLTSLLIELLEQWLAEQEREQVIAS